jgi:hypothetical protein
MFQSGVIRISGEVIGHGMFTASASAIRASA